MGLISVHSRLSKFVSFLRHSTKACYALSSRCLQTNQFQSVIRKAASVRLDNLCNASRELSRPRESLYDVSESFLGGKPRCPMGRRNSFGNFESVRDFGIAVLNG